MDRDIKPIIDEQFATLIARLRESEMEQLRQSLVNEGCRNALVVWRETPDRPLLLDGHHRLSIIEDAEAEGISIPYQVVEKEFASREAACEWVAANQLGQRNLMPFGRCLAAMVYEPRMRREADERRKSMLRQGDKAPVSPMLDERDFGRLYDILGHIAAVSHNTMSAAYYIKEHATEEDRERLLDPDTHLTIHGLWKELTKEDARRRTLPPPYPGGPTIRRQDALAFLDSFPEESADLLLTDPPYSTDIMDIVSFAEAWVPRALRCLRPTAQGYIFAGAYPEEMRAYLQVLLGQLKFEVANVLVWEYRNTLGPSPKRAYKLNWQAVFYLRGPEAPDLDCPELTELFSVQNVNAPGGFGNQYQRLHAWEKPAELAAQFILHSSRVEQLVLDPFVGTGTFLLEAHRLRRLSAGCDNDPEMLEIARARGCTIEG